MCGGAFVVRLILGGYFWAIKSGHFIPSGDDIDTVVTVMAGRPLVASQPSALRRPVGGWPGRPKQAPGHDGAWSVEVEAGWYYSGWLLLGVLYQAAMTLTLSLLSWPGARLWRPSHLRFGGRWADGRDARSRRPAMTALGGSKSRQAGIILGGYFWAFYTKRR